MEASEEVIEVSEEQVKQTLETICMEAKKGASRGYLELRLRATLAKTKWAYFLQMFRVVDDEKFLAFVYNLYLTVIGLRAPKVGRSW